MTKLLVLENKAAEPIMSLYALSALILRSRIRNPIDQYLEDFNGGRERRMAKFVVSVFK